MATTWQSRGGSITAPRKRSAIEPYSDRAVPRAGKARGSVKKASRRGVVGGRDSLMPSRIAELLSRPHTGTNAERSSFRISPSNDLCRPLQSWSKPMGYHGLGPLVVGRNYPSPADGLFVCSLYLASTEKKGFRAGTRAGDHPECRSASAGRKLDRAFGVQYAIQVGTRRSRHLVDLWLLRIRFAQASGQKAPLSVRPAATIGKLARRQVERSCIEPRSLSNGIRPQCEVSPSALGAGAFDMRPSLTLRSAPGRYTDAIVSFGQGSEVAG